MAHDWSWADDFLKGGRKKYERPLYDRNLRIWRDNKWDASSPIHIGWKYSGHTSSFVTYYKDGTTSIQGPIQTTHWGGGRNPLRSQSVRLTINRYAGIVVLQRNWQFYLQEFDAPLTPPKIQGCRTCSQTGLIDSWCSPDTCFDYDGEKCSTHPDAPQPKVSWFRTWHYIPCEHGNEMGHTVKRGQTCYYCNGTKKRDYGSKPFRTLWSGQSLRLRDGKIVQTTSTQSTIERMKK